jgi:hypothetical protein
MAEHPKYRPENLKSRRDSLDSLKVPPVLRQIMYHAVSWQTPFVSRRDHCNTRMVSLILCGRQTTEIHRAASGITQK